MKKTKENIEKTIERLSGELINEDVNSQEFTRKMAVINRLEVLREKENEEQKKKMEVLKIVVPIATTVISVTAYGLMYLFSMRMEYKDNMITPSPMKDLMRKI